MEYLAYVCAVGVAGSIVAWFRQPFATEKSPAVALRSFFTRLCDGCFSAYVIYEIAFFCTKDMRLSLAICGIGAFKGSGVLDIAISFFKEKFTLRDDEEPK